MKVVQEQNVSPPSLIQSLVTGLLLGPRGLFTLAALAMLDAKLTHAFLSVAREEAEETVTTAW